MSTDESYYPDVRDAVAATVKTMNEPVYGPTRREPTRRERRAARAKFRWPPPPRLPDETVQDFRIRELGLYVAARRAWKLKRRRATWGGNAWRPAA